MKYTYIRSVVCSVALVLSALSSSSYGAFAALGAWVGQNNDPSDPDPATNNYVVESPPLSAGSTFQVRRTRATSADVPRNAFLSDQTLVPGPVTFQQDLAVTGTLSFTNPNNVDPNFFFGFYSSANLTRTGTNGTATNAAASASVCMTRLGITIADSAVNAFRFQTGANSYDNASNTGGGATSNNLNTTGGGATSLATPVTAGTYPFSINFTASNKEFKVIVGPVSRTFTLPATFGATTTSMDSFGFLQLGDGLITALPVGYDVTQTLTFNVSNLNYTGETIPEPATWLLVGLALAPLIRRRAST